MASSNIAFIGGGNMATCLVGGLVAHQQPADSIWVSDPDTARLEMLQERFGVHTSSDNATAAGRAETVVLAVKPQVMRPVVESIRESVQRTNPLVMSVAAGVRAVDMEKWLGGDAAIVRCMPNTPALLGAGATGLFANERVSPTQRGAAESIMSAAGVTLWVDEEPLLDAVTAVSGSGPAYYFLLMELMEKAGTELGLSAEAARRLTLQTALGAARMALEAGEAPETLRRQVTSPAGTTEAAINSFLDSDMEAHVRKALTAARDRAIELGAELGDG